MVSDAVSKLAVPNAVLLSLEQKQLAVLSMHVADGGAATTDPQHCWRCVHFPA